MKYIQEDPVGSDAEGGASRGKINVTYQIKPGLKLFSSTDMCLS
jgi:hypothetical protein